MKSDLLVLTRNVKDCVQIKFRVAGGVAIHGNGRRSGIANGGKIRIECQNLSSTPRFVTSSGSFSIINCLWCDGSAIGVAACRHVSRQIYFRVRQFLFCDYIDGLAGATASEGSAKKYVLCLVIPFLEFWMF